MGKLSALHGLKTKRTQHSPIGLTFLTRPGMNLSELKEFENGLFEVQDEASQLVSLQVDCAVVV
jgi:16S rRNA C967 or C1407 C5-methylase (RsmB/RsmF family)